MGLNDRLDLKPPFHEEIEVVCLMRTVSNRLPELLTVEFSYFVLHGLRSCVTKILSESFRKHNVIVLYEEMSMNIYDLPINVV